MRFLVNSKRFLLFLEKKTSYLLRKGIKKTTDFIRSFLYIYHLLKERGLSGFIANVFEYVNFCYDGKLPISSAFYRKKFRGLNRLEQQCF